MLGSWAAHHPTACPRRSLLQRGNREASSSARSARLSKTADDSAVLSVQADSGLALCEHLSLASLSRRAGTTIMQLKLRAVLQPYIPLVGQSAWAARW
nr:hypothetical protein CFP56_09085 [Quercus suber]